ncbi:MAG: fimbrillin family protein [Rikenellaceae bacterium]|jgi:hypothetical protein|nr:fimbrillin family protein [Rikenellaceae bacterium]
MKKLFLFAAVAATILWAGCSNDIENAPDPQTANGQGQAIEFRAVVDKQTRATVRNGNMTSFFLQTGLYETNTESVTTLSDANFLTVPVYKNGASWTYSPVRYFPTESNKTLNFYAYSPIKDINMTTDLTLSGLGASFGYTVPVNQSVNNGAVDLLIAAVIDKTASTTTEGKGGVILNFNHALSAVTFSGRNQNAQTSTLIYVIHSIKILELENVGIFTYPTKTTSSGAIFAEDRWSITNNDDVDYIAGIPASGVALDPVGAAGEYVKLLSANDMMMVLPQSAGQKIVEVTYSLRDGSGKLVHDKDKRNLKLPIGFKFQAGTRYDFQFTFAGDSSSETPISFTVNVLSWADWDADEVPGTPNPILRE